MSGLPPRATCTVWLPIQSPHPTFNPRSADRVFPHRASPRQGPLSVLAGHNWVGLTCAACHTGQVNYHGASLLIEGGPAQNDIETFRAARRGLRSQCHQPRKGAAVRRAHSGAAAGPDPRRGPGQACNVLVRPRGTHASSRRRLRQPTRQPTQSGHARLDALGRGGNFLFAESTVTIGTTSRPPRRSASRRCGTRVLRLGAVQQFGAPAAGAQRGRGARRRRSNRLSTLNAPELQHHVRMDNLVDIQLWLQDLKSPKWPERDSRRDRSGSGGSRRRGLWRQLRRLPSGDRSGGARRQLARPEPNSRSPPTRSRRSAPIRARRSTSRPARSRSGSRASRSAPGSSWLPTRSSGNTPPIPRTPPERS